MILIEYDELWVDIDDIHFQSIDDDIQLFTIRIMLNIFVTSNSAHKPNQLIHTIHFATGKILQKLKTIQFQQLVFYRYFSKCAQ